MSEPVSYIPAGHHTLAPHIIVNGAEAAIAFYGKVLDARLLSKVPAQDGRRIMHAELQFGDSILMLCDEFPEFGTTMTNGNRIILHHWTKDIDEVFARAIANGATVKFPLADQFWGDRYGQFMDPWGHTWSLGKRLKNINPDEHKCQ